MTMMYKQQDMLISYDEQKFVKQTAERWLINLPNLCEVWISDEKLLLGDEELFFEDNLVAIKNEIFDNIEKADVLQQLKEMPETELRLVLQRAYVELDKILKFDNISWITPLIMSNNVDRGELLVDLTMQRKEDRKKRGWEKPV